MKIKSTLMLLLGAGSLFLPAQAEITFGIYADIRLGRALPPPPPEIVVVEPVGPAGPPPWAHHHWYRRSHAYYYYPGCNVYYRPDTRAWFYLEGNRWQVGVNLPEHIRVDFGRAVSLQLETDRPYVYHEQVVTYYPENYFAKVKVVGRARGPGDDDDQPGNRSDGHPGKGHGKKPKH